MLLAATVLLAIVASLCISAYPLSLTKALRIVAHLALPVPLPDDPPWNLKELTVVQIVRLPRVLLATLAGMGLGLAGAALQGIMRNPLAGPDLVGVSSGAAFGGVLAMMMDGRPRASSPWLPAAVWAPCCSPSAWRSWRRAAATAWRSSWLAYSSARSSSRWWA